VGRWGGGGRVKVGAIGAGANYTQPPPKKKLSGLVQGIGDWRCRKASEKKKKKKQLKVIHFAPPEKVARAHYRGYPDTTDRTATAEIHILGKGYYICICQKKTRFGSEIFNFSFTAV